MFKDNWVMMVVLIVAIVLRFWNFSERWVINQDQARDAIIGMYGLRNEIVPAIGPYSSSGPYNFGPWYYGVIMFWEIMLGKLVMGPWIGFGLMSAVGVGFLMKSGEIMGGKKMGIITGVLAAIASASVKVGPEMLNTVLVGVFGSVAWWAIMKFMETKRNKYGVLLGLMVGVAINCHFQALGLLALPLMSVILVKTEYKKKIIGAISMGTGLVGSFGPLIVFDLQRRGVWIRSVVWYYTEGVKKFYVPIRWLTEIRDFWPQLIGKVITNNEIVGYGILLIIVTGIAALVIKRKVDRKMTVLGVGFLIQVGLMRSYQGTRSEEYMIAFHGFIILMTALGLWGLTEVNRRMGLILFGCVLMAASWGNIGILNQKSQARAVEEIYKTVEGKVEIYQKGQSNMISLPIFYMKYFDDKVGDGGRKIGFCDATRNECFGKVLIKNIGPYYAYEIDERETLEYEKLTPELVYSWLWVNYGK